MLWHHDNRKHDEVKKMIGNICSGYKTIATGDKENSFTLIESRTGALFMEEAYAPVDVVEIMSSLQPRKKRGKLM